MRLVHSGPEVPSIWEGADTSRSAISGGAFSAHRSVWGARISEWGSEEGLRKHIKASFAAT